MRALTPRGRAFIAAGMTALVCGIAFGARDLVQVGVLVSALPVLTAAWVARSGHRLEVYRTLSASQVETGQSSAVRLRLENRGPATGVLLLEERVPAAMQVRPRFVMDSMPSGWHGSIDYALAPVQRGKYDIGPLTITISDPFGMTGLRRPFEGTSSLIVTPRVERLPPIRLRGAWAGSGDSRPRPFTTGDVADVTVRDYRLGDDLRRVHWPSTARTGDLMVRREERPWQARCTLFLDNRTSSHRGRGPDSSLEKAIVATASVAVHLAAHGYQVRLVCASGEELGHAWHDGGLPEDAQPMLERLAMLRPARSQPLQLDGVDESTGQPLFVAVLGDTDEHDLGFLARLHHRGAACALVVAAADWDTHRADAPAPMATTWLRSRGWQAATLGRATPVSHAWQELGR